MTQVIKMESVKNGPMQYHIKLTFRVYNSTYRIFRDISLVTGIEETNFVRDVSPKRKGRRREKLAVFFKFRTTQVQS